jgi:hypothetical protein
MENTEEQPDATVGQAAALLSGAAAAAEQTVVPALQEALLEVSEEPAFALEMSLFEGKSDAAIASVMNISKEDARSLKEEARRQLLDTELGREVGQSGLSDMLELADRYLRQQSGSGHFQEDLSEALETDGALETDESFVPERASESMSEPMERLWKRIADELDATMEQLVGVGSAAIEGFGPARAMAASREAEEERRDYSFEIDAGHRYYGKLVWEAADRWRIFFEVHSESLEDVNIGYEILSKEGQTLHQGKVRLEKFSDEIYEGSEVIGSLKISDESTPLEIRVVEVEWKEEE